MKDPSVAAAEAYESLFVPALFGACVMIEADVCGWLPLMGVTLADATVEAIASEAEVALARHVVADGSMRFEVAAHIATARSSANPGSAR